MITVTLTVDSQPAAEKEAVNKARMNLCRMGELYALGATLDSARAHLVTGDRERAEQALREAHQ